MANPFDAAADLQWPTRSAFRGAEITRLSADVWPSVNHPNTELKYAIRTLRARARDLVRNNAYAAGAVEAIADNVVGWEGIRCKPRITVPFNAPQGEPLREVNHAIERGWKDWATEHATVDGVEGWFETERLALKLLAQDGELFLRRRRGWSNPYAYAVELLDPDLLDETFNEDRERRGREVVMGVELDPFGRPVAYHFWRDHPDSMRRRERERIPAEEIVHLFVRYRPGQVRGYSWFAPVLTTNEMLDGYTEAELVAARYHASKMGFISNDSPEAAQVYATRLKLQAKDGKDAPARRVKMAPGVVEELVPGQKFEGFDPTHPNDAFDPFLRVLLRGMARGLSMSYMTFSGDVSDANYSSQRGALPPERDHWKALQNVVARRLHRPVYRDWIATSLLTGALDLPSMVASNFYAVDWRGRRWTWVDPLDDIQVAEREVALGITSRQRLASDRGHDFETIVDETREDLDYAEEQDVDVGGVDAKVEDRTQKNGQGASSNGNRFAHMEPSNGW